MTILDRDLAEIGRRAMAEHQAWKERNAARSALRKFFKAYTEETGERFDRGDCLDGGMHEGVAAFNAVSKLLAESQRRLTSARAATRRAVAKVIKEAVGDTKTLDMFAEVKP
jgi:hypothetical protein